MGFTNIGKSGVTLGIGSLWSGRPQYMAIGSGSGTVASTDVTLVHEVSRTSLTSGSIDIITHKIDYVADWNSVTMSGITLRELGMFTDSSDNTGSLWNREGFTGVSFDGSNELQVQLKYEIY